MARLFWHGLGPWWLAGTIKMVIGEVPARIIGIATPTKPIVVMVVVMTAPVNQGVSAVNGKRKNNNLV